MSLKTYSIATDITAQAVSEAKLHKEIKDNFCVNGFDGVIVTGDVLEILGNSTANETLLDSLVLNHDGVSVISKSRQDILADVLTNAEPITQLPRLLNSLDKYPSVMASLDNFNYLLAYSRILLAETNGDITSEDTTLILGCFPAGWNA